MQGCQKRRKGGKRRAAAKLLCIVSTPPVRWRRRPPYSLGGWAGIAKQQTEECTQDLPSSVKPIAETRQPANVVGAHNVNN
jgi:hypothetical protein